MALLLSEIRMTTARLESPAVSAIALLGGEGVLHAKPRVVMDWIPLVRQGLPSACIDAVVGMTRITQSDLARALAIPERTLARRKREGALSPEESAKLLRFARLVERAEEVFENADSALNWLQSPNASLGGVTPLSLLDTDIGADTVLDTLGRIAHGVFA
jgi:putative toxin-antitoxin system antitoxin component (TIGR02293 family)